LGDVRQGAGTAVAYRTAEKNILLSILSVDDPILDGIRCCNLAKAARAWIRKYKQKEYEVLPRLLKTANDFTKKTSEITHVCLSFDKVQSA